MPTQVDEATWQAKLHDMAQRNEAIDMTPDSDGDLDASVPAFRVRVLNLGKDSILIEFPTSHDTIKFFRPDAVLRLTLGVSQARWEMHVKVIGRVKLKLNETTRVPALRVTLPTTVKVGQRRDFYRAPTAAMNVQPVLMLPLESREFEPPDGDLRILLRRSRKEEVDPKNPDQYRPMTAKLLNISGAGIGVAITDQEAIRVAANQWFWTQIELPTSDQFIQAFAMAIRLDQQTPDVYHLGMKLEWIDPLSAKESIESIVRFTTWVQRSQLKKRSAI